MSRIVWIDDRAARAIHAQQISIFGGDDGILDAGKLLSALDRPKNVRAYNPQAGTYELAAAYGWGICQNHPFLDGNKRTAFVVMMTFLAVNGIKLVIPEIEVVVTMLGVAAGEISEAELCKWLKSY